MIVGLTFTSIILAVLGGLGWGIVIAWAAQKANRN